MILGGLQLAVIQRQGHDDLVMFSYLVMSVLFTVQLTELFRKVVSCVMRGISEAVSTKWYLQQVLSGTCGTSGTCTTSGTCSTSGTKVLLVVLVVLVQVKMIMVDSDQFCHRHGLTEVAFSIMSRICGSIGRTLYMLHRQLQWFLLGVLITEHNLANPFYRSVHGHALHTLHCTPYRCLYW